eukprot:TRINITY_DN17605_c0_g2_i1.p1 TRINITY_DN17605_c0_g2~~TRINITY_DN17605_c0_g2_i1.p1  ORF type:complete len:250 (-),score=17.08 TRINITY_DN17605_c0_g2_i1:120-869(-)
MQAKFIKQNSTAISTPKSIGHITSKVSGFQSTQVGVIYEEMSMMDTFDYNANESDLPSLFCEESANILIPLSDAALELKPKSDNSSNGRRLKETQRIHSNMGKECKIKLPKHDHAKLNTNIYKLNSLLIGNAPENILRADSLIKTANAREQKNGGGITKFFSRDRPARVPNLPLLRQLAKPEKEFTKTSYKPFNKFINQPAEVHMEAHKNTRSATGSGAKPRRTRSGEGTPNTLKHVFIRGKAKLRNNI